MTITPSSVSFEVYEKTREQLTWARKRIQALEGKVKYLEARVDAQDREVVIEANKNQRRAAREAAEAVFRRDGA